MNSLTDQQLLREYTGQQSEPAFAELVRRHVDFVYSAAVRMVRDAHLAEDVTQGVFMALARDARQLVEHPVLSGWLHRTARNLAANAVRTDVRRRTREQEAATMNELLAAEPNAVWEQIAPHLDDVLGELNEPDRDALLLRYFERKSAQEMAQTLGISAEAAQKRVNRAVERLRDLFARRGVAVGASGLAVLISANAVQAAPAGLAVTLSTAAATGLALAATTTTKTIAMTALQKAILVTAIAASVATPLVMQHQTQTRLRAENQALREQVDGLARLRAENDRLAKLLAQSNSSPALPPDKLNELLRLRGEVGLLRQQTNELVGLQAENQRLRSLAAMRAVQLKPPQEASATPGVVPRESWGFAGYANPESAFLSAVWARSKGDVKSYLAGLAPDSQEVQQLANRSDEQFAAETKRDFDGVTAFRIVGKENVSDNEVILTIHADGPNEEGKFRLQKIGDEWKFGGPVKGK